MLVCVCEREKIKEGKKESSKKAKKKKINVLGDRYYHLLIRIKKVNDDNEWATQLRSLTTKTCDI